MGKFTNKPKAPEAPAVDAAPEAPAPVKVVYPYEIAPGKAITCRRGVIGEGKGVTDRDLFGGEKAMKVLVEKGYVIKN